jgi:hypothetical protein
VDGLLDLGHTSPGWTNLLEQGMNGLMETAHRLRAAFGDAITPEQADFYDAVDIVYKRDHPAGGRVVPAGAGISLRSTRNTRTLTLVADTLEQVPAGTRARCMKRSSSRTSAPDDRVWEGERVRSMGGFDRL